MEACAKTNALKEIACNSWLDACALPRLYTTSLSCTVFACTFNWWGTPCFNA